MSGFKALTQTGDKKVADILSWDTYSIRNNSWYYTNKHREWAMYGYEEMVLGSWFGGHKGEKLSSANIPVWAVIQANSEATMYLPTTKEIKANTYLAITMNVMGIEYYIYNPSSFHNAGGLESSSTLFNYVRQISRELNGLSPILTLPTKEYAWQYDRPTSSLVKFSPEPIATIYTDPNTWDKIGGKPYNYYKLNYRMMQDAGKTYLIVLNKDPNAVANIEITISGLFGIMNATTLGFETSGSQRAGRTITVTNGKFTDSFDGMSVHIYQICSGTCPALLTPTCSDSIQNQGETGIDCGGPCPACASHLPTQLTLKPGWNQISSPVAAGINLATIESSCTILPYKTYKLWAWNATAQAWLNPAKVEPLKGYWIYAAYQCTVPLSGTQATFTSLPLSIGWNKVSASGTLSAIAGACANHITGNWIWHWDKATEKWVHPATMQLDKGYWIKVDPNCVLG